jgi:hypothetical protein
MGLKLMMGDSATRALTRGKVGPAAGVRKNQARPSEPRPIFGISVSPSRAHEPMAGQLDRLRRRFASF